MLFVEDGDVLQVADVFPVPPGEDGVGVLEAGLVCGGDGPPARLCDAVGREHVFIRPFPDIGKVGS